MTLAWWLEFSPKARETLVQSQIDSFQILKKWYLMFPCLTLSIIRYGSTVRGAIQGKEQHPPLHLGVVAIEKGSFWSLSITVANFTYIYIYIYIYSSLSIFIHSSLSFFIYSSLLVSVHPSLSVSIPLDWYQPVHIYPGLPVSISTCLFQSTSICLPRYIVAQSDRTVEYTDCFTAEG